MISSFMNLLIDIIYFHDFIDNKNFIKNKIFIEEFIENKNIIENKDFIENINRDL